MKPLSTKPRIAQRQQRNRELGARDAANRCPVCRRALEATGGVVRWSESHETRVRYCSSDCADDAITVRA